MWNWLKKLRNRIKIDGRSHLPGRKHAESVIQSTAKSADKSGAQLSLVVISMDTKNQTRASMEALIKSAEKHLDSRDFLAQWSDTSLLAILWDRDNGNAARYGDKVQQGLYEEAIAIPETINLHIGAATFGRDGWAWKDVVARAEKRTALRMKVCEMFDCAVVTMPVSRARKQG